MSFHQVFDFLRDLNKNNHKTWMDDHRATYHEVRDFVIDWNRFKGYSATLIARRP